MLYMKRHILILILAFFTAMANAQITQRLKAEIASKPNELYEVSIAFPRYVDVVQLQQNFQQNNATAANRLKIINRLLQQEAANLQQEALKILNKKKMDEVAYIYSFYAVNRIITKTNAQTIAALAALPEVQSIDLAKGEIEFFEPVDIQQQAYKTTTSSQAEPGLLAINAPAMWQLGYTGRGRKAYVYDTGIWTTHPAFSSRFLGNFSPISESWYGHYSQIPRDDVGSSHGTHVLGTIAGLDHAQTDTIGVAFGAYWMACDLIKGASQASQLPQQVYMIAAFEWALNPDGDTNTTDDVPDVINNSWRWRDIIDTAECDGFIAQLMATIEAAGIANVFSGGNTGPNNAGVNSPQRIATSEVNTFTVGAVNANVSAPYPIASFSTRGPTQCASTGSLQKFPEVVAPGQSVRSAYNRNSYALLSGTSMASPHVSGAVLLLKEAFPNVAGSEILSALYNSAIDYGAVGEDNTYGKGLIDVYAAFQLLSLNHTPFNPNNIAWDVAIHSITNINDFECDTQIKPVITLKNLGTQTIDTVFLSVYNNGVATSTINLPIATNNFLGGSTFTIPNNLVYPLSAGENEWRFEVNIANNDFDPVNNARYLRFKKLDVEGLPFLEDFESGIDATRWTYHNPDLALTWDTTTVIGWPGNTLSAVIELQNNLTIGEKDGLITPQINLPNTNNLSLSFDIGYAYRGIQFLADTFKISISEDCGQSFQNILTLSDTSLASTSSTSSLFTLQSKNDWQRHYLSLANYAGKSVLLKFETTNRQGYNLHLDNIALFEGSFDPFSLTESALQFISISPNPTNDFSIIKLNDEHLIGAVITITNMQGRLMTKMALNQPSTVINVQHWPAGVYLVAIETEHGFLRKKIVKF